MDKISKIHYHIYLSFLIFIYYSYYIIYISCSRVPGCHTRPPGIAYAHYTPTLTVPVIFPVGFNSSSISCTVTALNAVDTVTELLV